MNHATQQINTMTQRPLSKYFQAFDAIEGPDPNEVEALISQAKTPAQGEAVTTKSSLNIGYGLGIAGLATAIVTGTVLLLPGPKEPVRETALRNELPTDQNPSSELYSDSSPTKEEGESSRPSPSSGRVSAAGKNLLAAESRTVPSTWRLEPQLEADEITMIPSPRITGYDYDSYIITNPEGLNSPQLDYAPTITSQGTQLYFVSNRPGGKGGHDIWRADKEDPLSTEFAQPVNIGSPINTAENEGVMTISSDGRKVYFTACGRLDGVGDCDIYEAEFDGTERRNIRNLWEINSSGWDAQPSISSSGDTIYFTSNRPGALGGTSDVDIYMATRKKDGSWNRPVNLGESINTPKREDSPFILPDGKRLYFSTEGREGYGKLDFFVAERQKDGSWGAPENLGPNFNSPENDRMLTASADENILYFCSERTTPSNTGGLDIFMAVRNRGLTDVPTSSTVKKHPAQERRLTVIPNPATDIITLKFPTDYTSDPNAEISIFDRMGNEVMHLAAGRAEEPISISDLPNGLYLIRVGTLTGTLQVQR